MNYNPMGNLCLWEQNGSCRNQLESFGKLVFMVMDLSFSAGEKTFCEKFRNLQTFTSIPQTKMNGNEHQTTRTNRGELK